MNLFNKKGKIFSKIHPVDLVVILIILASVSIGIKIFFKKEEWVEVKMRGMPGEWWWGNWAMPYWVVDAVKTGDSEFNIMGKKTAEIIDIEKYETGGSHKDYIVRVKLNAARDAKTERFKYRGRDLQIGSPLILQPAKKLIAGNVIWIEGGGQESAEKEFELLIKLYDRYPWEAEAIKLNETMTDGSKKTIAKILDKTIELSEMTVVTDWGEVLTRRNPLKRDISLKVKILAVNHAGQWFFKDNELIKVGRSLNISLPNFQIDDGLIIQILTD